MRLLIGIILTFAVAATIGLGSTYFTLSHGTTFGALQVGAWTARPKTGSADIDPYARATLSRTGGLPLSSGDGVAFTAVADEAGRPFNGRCEVFVRGATPQARYWTLTLYNPDGHLVANAINRYGFTSQELTRKSDGSFEIAIAPRARPGNWLPTGGIDTYVLVLRLYDTPVGVATRAGRETTMPTITQGSCP